MIRITDQIAIDESEIEYDFVRASGPGGQHVNRAATAVQLRFDVANSSSLPKDIRRRLVRLAGNQISAEGILIIKASRFRSQHRNRKDAMDRLVGLIGRAARKPRIRRTTKPTRAAKERRLRAKRRRSEVKRMRRPSRERY